MESLTQKISERERNKEMTNVHLEALKYNDQIDHFRESNYKSREGLLSGIEDCSLVPEKEISVVYWKGNPVFGKKRIVRGKVADVDYNVGEDSELGYIEFKGWRRRRIDFGSIVDIDYDPKATENEKSENRKERKLEDRESRKKEKMRNDAWRIYGSRNSCYIDIGNKIVRGGDFEDALERMANKNDLVTGTVRGRGSSTGLGCGYLVVNYLANKKGEIKVVFGEYENMGKLSFSGDILANTICGDGFVPERIDSSLSSVASIGNWYLRKFVADFYEELDKSGSGE